MTTTAIVAEILIVGLFTVTAAIAVTASAVGVDLGWLQSIKDWSVTVTLGLVAVAYPLGIGIDRISDTVFGRLERPLVRPKLAMREEELRFRVWGSNPPERALSFFDYARGRRRIARSTCLVSVVAVGVALGWSIWTNRLDSRVVIVGSLLALISGWTWWRIGVMYNSRLTLAHRVYVLKQPEGTGVDLEG